VFFKKIAAIIRGGKAEFKANFFDGFVRKFQFVPGTHNSFFGDDRLGIYTQSFLVKLNFEKSVGRIEN
jgi:hypothetical protein